MGPNLEQFANDLRSTQNLLQSAMQRIFTLLADGDGISQTDLDLWLARLEQERAQNAERRSIVALEEQARAAALDSVSPEAIADWVQHRHTAQLHAHVDRMEESASAALELALIAITDAEHAVARVITERRRAVAAQIRRDGP